MKLILFLLVLVICQLCLAEEATPAKAKNETGPGHSNSYNRRHHGHYGRKNNYGHKRHHYRAPIVDDYVCDLEATILVVSSKHHVKEEKSYDKNQSYGKGGQSYGGGNNNYGGQPSYGGGNNNYGGQSYGGEQPYGGGNNNYGGQSYGGEQSYGGGNNNYGGEQSYGGGNNNYGGQDYDTQSYGSSPSYGGNNYENKPKRHEYASPEALRLKCSHIAVNSERDCQVCCKLSARRYHSVSRHEIFGFVIDASEIKYDDKGYVRNKRQAASYNAQPAPPTQNYQSQAPSYGSAPAPSYGSAPAPSYGSAPAPSYGPAPAPSYGSAPAPSYGSAPAPSYEASPTQGYGVEAPVYETTSGYAEGQTGYQTQAPGYGGDGYPSSDSYAPTSHKYYGPPKNARCVCCAPKRGGHHSYPRHHSYERSYESHSDEY